jgi:hypothetical protein
MSASPKSNERLIPTLAAIAPAVVLAFTDANAAGLVGDKPALIRYTPALIKTIDAVSDDPAVQSRAGGFTVELEKALGERGEQSRIVDYPKPVSANMLWVTAVVPPKGLEELPIPVCAEQNSKIVGTWNITAKGEVAPASWTGPRESEGNSAACKGFILAARTDINQKLAEMNSGKPTPYSTTPPAARPQAAGR